MLPIAIACALPIRMRRKLVCYSSWFNRARLTVSVSERKKVAKSISMLSRPADIVVDSSTVQAVQVHAETPKRHLLPDMAPNVLHFKH